MRYTIQSFTTLSDNEGYGPRGAFKYGENLDIRKSRDTLSCGQALKDETPPAQGFNSLMDWYIPMSDGSIVGLCRNGRIYKRASNGTWTLEYTDGDGQIYGGWQWGISNGKSYLFYATATDLHAKEWPGLANWSDLDANIVVGATTYTYPKTNLTTPGTGYNHMMKGIGGGIGGLPICNDETLAFVGYDGSYTTEILRFTPGNASKLLLQRGNNLIMGTTAKNQLVQSALFLWDGMDTEEVFGWDDIKTIPLKDLGAMIDTEVPLLVDGNGRVYYSDFTSGMPLFTFPDNGKVSPGGVTNDDYLALFGVWDNSPKSGIYSYGRKWKNSPMAVNLEYKLDCDEIGAIIRAGDNLLISYKDGETYGVKNIDSSNKATAIYQTIDLPKPIKYPFQKSPTWDAVTLSTEPLPEGCSISCKYKMNKQGDFKVANLLTGGTSFTATGGQEAVFLVKDKGDIAELELTLTPSGNTTPEIRRIDWEFN